MAKSLYCKINLFTMPQTVILFDEDNVVQSYNTNIEELSNIINGIILSVEDIVKIEFYGHRDFIEGLSKKITNRNVRIYINGEVYDQ